MLSATPTRNEVLEYFHRTNWDDWMHHNANSSYAGHDPNDPTHNPIYVCNSNVRLRIERGKVAVQDFQEDWIEGFPDPDATSHSYWLYYGDSPITQKVLVAVDGYRAFLPVPTVRDDPPTLKPQDAHWGKIVTRDMADFERALSYSGIEIEE